MGVEFSAIVLFAGYCFAGMGALVALGVVETRARDLSAALGLEFIVGVALVLLVGIALLCVGVSVGLPVLGSLAALIGAGGFAVAWRRSFEPRALTGQEATGRRSARSWLSRSSIALVVRRARSISLDGAVAIVAIVVLAVLAVVTVRWARVQPLSEWDAWSIWARKGTLLYDYGHLPTRFFTSPQYAFMAPDFPLLLPLYESSWFHAVGGADTQSLHVWFWVLFVASLWAVAYLGARVARPFVWAPFVGLLAVTPAIWGHLMTMYADVPMGMFLLVGTLALGSWVVCAPGDKRLRGGHLPLATILLAAAGSIKNEGLTAAASALVAATIVVGSFGAPGLSRRRALALLAVAGAGFAAVVAPWRVWVAAHGIRGEISVSKGLDPSFLAAHADRIHPAASALFSEVSDQSNWCYLLPIGLAVLITGLATRRLRPLAVFYCLAVAGSAAMILWAYVISPNELTWLIGTSASRTVVGPMLILAAGTLHLAGALTCDIRRRSREPARGFVRSRLAVGVRR